ncbi:MAG: nucleotidyltransferase domain-containing protein, partial [Oscillospiraceae bacterium]|nr:nucleotidyltransferase domain-containing protein [Oscillospiraceae bacterium]
MNAKVKEELDNIVKTLADTGMVSKIILFGSMARGDDTPDSDIDLCVLTPITDRRAHDVAVDLRMKLWGVKNMPLDLLAYPQDRFAEYS